ncbi:MAG: helical bundle domain-containing protein [Legionella sp.]|nr:helical bundle domain-containing protein [Legionella sp.]
MFLSSVEYFKALREGNYIGFLLFPVFIEKKYREEGHPFSGDALADCLMYEWITQGYCEQVEKKMQILYAVYLLEPSPLQTGVWAYYVTNLISAFYTFKAYHLNGLSVPSPSSGAMTCKQIDEFMREQLGKLGDGVFKNSISQIRMDFIKESEQVKKKEVNAVCLQISAMTKLVALVSEYVDFLSINKTQANLKDRYLIRLGLVQRLYAYLNEQTELTDGVYSKINYYVAAIREQNPFEWEEFYLKKIVLPTIAEKILGGVTYFFQSVVPASTNALVSEMPDAEDASSLDRSA